MISNARRSGPRRPPRLSQLLLRLRRLGSRRDEIEADLRELFQIRAAEHGLLHATWRHWVDVISLWFRRRPAPATSFTGSESPRQGRGRGGVAQDVIFAIRVFRRQPASFLIAVLGLALAIGLGTAVFSVVNAVALRGFGIAAPDEVFSVVLDGEVQGGAPWTHPDYVQLQKVASSISLAATGFYEGSFTGRSSPNETANERNLSYGWVTDVSGTYFPVLGARAALGRTLTPPDDMPAAERVMVLSHLFWRNQLGGDPAIVGQTIKVSDTPFTVIGVAERGFTGPTPAASAPPAGWITLSVKAEVVKEQEEARARVTRARAEELNRQPSLTPAERQRLDDLAFVLGRTRPPWNYVRLLGRLAPGVTREQAEGDVRARFAALQAEGGRAEPPRPASVRLLPVDERRADRVAGIGIVSILVAVGLVVLLASANVANLLLASAVVRRREIGTRLALGASRGRVIRQLLTESVLLGVLAGAAGLVMAFWLAPAFAAFMRLPPAIDISPDLTVYTFLTILIALVGIASGLAPARYARRGDLMAVVKSDQLGAPTPLPRSLFRHVLVGAQAAGAMVLLVMAALLARSLLQAANVDLGFEPDRFVSIDIGNGTNGRAWEGPRRAAFWDAALPRVRQIPGVESASLASIFPLGSTSAHGRLPDGRPVNRQETSAEFFDTMGVRLLRGRTFTDEDVRSAAPVAVISETLARQYWGVENPIGSTLERVWGSDDPQATRPGGVRKPAGTRVIGIVAEILSELRPGTVPLPTIYLPVAFTNVPDLIVRVKGDPHTLVRPIEQALQSVDPDVAGWNVQFARDGLDRALEVFRVLALLGSIAGSSALVLAVVGLFGVAAFAIGQRQHEMSVRMTLGASPRDIVRLLFRESLAPVVIGLVIGLGAAMLASQVVRHLLFGIGPRDPIAMLAAAALLLAAALLAILPPVRRAARVNLAEMLRQA